MKKTLLKTIGFSLSLVTAAALATAPAPADMTIINSTCLLTNAYVHNNASPNALLPHSSESITWDGVTNLCHNTTTPLLKSSDPCAFEVYATDDSANPKKIDVGTVTFYLSDGHITAINNKAINYGLKIRALAPGQLELDGL